MPTRLAYDKYFKPCCLANKAVTPEVYKSMYNNLTIRVHHRNKAIYFDVKEYPCDDLEQCKFKVFLDGNYMACFQTSCSGFIDVSNNPGALENGILDILAEEIENNFRNG